MHRIKPLLLNPTAFRRRFRLEKSEWVYDPSFGRRCGRPVSDAEVKRVLSDFSALHAVLNAEIDWAAKLFIPSVFLLPVLALWLGSTILATTVAIGLMLILSGKIIHSNYRLFAIAHRFWRMVQYRPETDVLSTEKQIELGYRFSWKNRIWISLTLIVVIPFYMSAHLGRNVLREIPHYGNTVAAAYPIFVVGVCVGASIYFLVGRTARHLIAIWRIFRHSQPLEIGLRKISVKPRPHPRGDLSGVERINRR